MSWFHNKPKKPVVPTTTALERAFSGSPGDFSLIHGAALEDIIVALSHRMNILEDFAASNNDFQSVLDSMPMSKTLSPWEENE